MDHKIRRRVVVTLATAALALLGLATSMPSAAQASCPRGDFCLYEHIYFQGGQYNWSGNT